MATQEEVAGFLKGFKEKMKIFDIIFRDDRGKNALTLAILDIPPIERKRIIEKLSEKDYVEGPVADSLNKSTDMWVFGKTIKKHEVYIKITMGFSGKPTICISFHIAEHPMNYPYKKLKGGSKNE